MKIETFGLKKLRGLLLCQSIDILNTLRYGTFPCECFVATYLPKIFCAYLPDVSSPMDAHCPWPSKEDPSRLFGNDALFAAVPKKFLRFSGNFSYFSYL